MKTDRTKGHIYEPRLGVAMFMATVMIILVGIFGVKWFIQSSIWNAILGFCALIGFVIFALPVVNHHNVIVKGSRITFSSRLGVYLVCKMPDDLYQIITKDGKPVSFVFKVGDNIAQVSPQGYKNGDQLLEYFEKAMRKERGGAEIVLK